MVYEVPHYLNGKKHSQVGAKTKPITNPADGTIIGQVPLADKALCEAAIAAAQQAFPAWSETPPLKRARVLFKFRELLEKYQDELARIVTREHGKTLGDAKGSVARAIEVVEYHCGLATQLQGSISVNVSNQMDCYTIRQPLGICVGVSPFNFPVMVPVWMMIPAIACGNAFILKPSEQDPSATLRLLEWLTDAGLPAGIAQCLQGDKSTVDYLLTHPEVKALTAVASTPVAEYIYKTATAHGKRAHTFGGAKNHALLMPDADFEQTAQAIATAAFGSAGERCMAISVVVAVGGQTADRLIQHLVPLIKAIRIEPGEALNSDMGPLISQAHRERVLALVEEGVREGAKPVVDGRGFKHPQYPDGYFMGPVLFDHVEESMSVYQQEIFGPVLCVMRVDSFEQALALINRNQYGNGAAIFTRDGYTARQFSQQVQVGMVGVNVPVPVPVANHPFGGWKRSSFGDTNMHGMESIHFYTRRKTMTSKWPTTALEERHSFAMPVHD